MGVAVGGSRRSSESAGAAGVEDSGSGRRLVRGCANKCPRFVEPRGDEGNSSGLVGKALMDDIEAVRVDDCVGAGALAVEAEENGDGC